jgi:hypothetical protein
MSVWDFARTPHRAINMRCMRFLRGFRIELLMRDFARTSHRAINMRCMRFLRKRRNVAKKSDAMLRRKATQCYEEKRRNVAKTKTTKCKQSYCDVSSFKNKFFVQVRRYIRLLMQENNWEIKNFDVLEILQLKFSCMKIYTENINFRWKMYDSLIFAVFVKA